ncbi:hypothetical protein AGMMS49975_25110 [Clostridia bacterium]|nr:hypothetical protein AGMMS49975_25110 [Clostridia bacterium]
MLIVSRSAVMKLAKEADRLPENLLVIGVGFVMSAKRVKIACKTCGQQIPISMANGVTGTYEGLIDADLLLNRVSNAEKYGAMLVVPADEIRQLGIETEIKEFKCTACGDKNFVK